MQKLTTAAMLVLAAMSMQANAQNHQFVDACVHALKNASPIVNQAACNG